MKAWNTNSSHSPTKFSQAASLTTYTIWSLFSLLVYPAPHPLLHVLDHLYVPHYKSTITFSDALHHLSCNINSLLRSVDFILFTLLLIHLILRILPYHSHHLHSYHLHFHSHHLSLFRPFTPDIKLTNPFLHNLSDSFLTAFMDLELVLN